MKYYLLKMKVSGIKNLDKEIELQFYKQVLNRTFNPDKYNVKAIYGTNGSGKTALIYAAEIYKKFVLSPNYLALYNSNSSLNNLINKNKKELFIKMTFAVLSDDYKIQNIYAHTMCLYNENNQYSVKSEILQKLHGLRLNEESKYETIYLVEKGEIKTEYKELEDICKNVVIDRSVTSNILNRNLNKYNKDYFNKILDVIGFASSMTILIGNSDKNYMDFDFISSQIDAISKYSNKMDKKIFFQLMNNKGLLYNDEIIIKKSKFDEFSQQVSNLCKFIKVFKNDLWNIEIKKEENGENYNCNLIFVYSNGLRISKQYESTGIKKLMNIYYALCNVEKGGIVFIDEFDANIHDVILLKIIEYFTQYSKGQLIFTTHNMGPMDILQRNKCSIDFLSDDSRITSWKTMGNSSAQSIYRKGLIKYSPFNIEAFNFLGVFGDDDK